MNNPQRRRLMGLAGWAGVLATLGMTSEPAQAQEFPSRPINLVVPFATGGPTDAMARMLANALRTTLGQPVIVENKPGAGGNIGADAVARATPDGYTLLFGTSGPLAINQFLYSKVSYHPEKSFAPVIRIGHLPNVLLVNPQVPAKNVAELVALAKNKPDSLSFASSGNGASSHLAGVMFNQRADTQLQHIPYRGTGPALNDLLGGQVGISFTDVLTARPHLQAGKLRALGVTTATRSKVLPDLPTLEEQGIKDMDVSVFFGIVAPAGTPKPVIERLNGAFAKAMTSPDLRKWLNDQGVEVEEDSSPEHLSAYIRKESVRWRDVIAKAGIRAD